jgi:glycosyltransferase involved in cell wall biosynthesis
MIDTSLIVSTLGRTQKLGRLLRSLRGLTVAPAEIIIVDQNPPGFLDPVLAEFPDLPIVHARSARGLSRARNVGLKLARGRIVGFPDDDCWYPAEVLVHARQAFADRSDLKLLTGCTTDASGAISVSPHLDHSAEIGRANVFRVGNSNTIFVDRELAVQAGGFDETLGVGADTPFQSGEETDFILRCLEVGGRGYFDRTLIVHHEQSDQAAWKQLDRVRAYSAGFGRVLRLHRFGVIFVADRLARASASALICLVRRDLGGAAQRRAWILGTLRGFTASR